MGRTQVYEETVRSNGCGQKVASKREKTIRQCECEKKFCCMAEFFRSPRKSVRLEKQKYQ